LTEEDIAHCFRKFDVEEKDIISIDQFKKVLRGPPLKLGNKNEETVKIA